MKLIIAEKPELDHTIGAALSLAPAADIRGGLGFWPPAAVPGTSTV